MAPLLLPSCNPTSAVFGVGWDPNPTSPQRRTHPSPTARGFRGGNPGVGPQEARALSEGKGCDIRMFPKASSSTPRLPAPQQLQGKLTPSQTYIESVTKRRSFQPELSQGWGVGGAPSSPRTQSFAAAEQGLICSQREKRQRATHRTQPSGGNTEKRCAHKGRKGRPRAQQKMRNVVWGGQLVGVGEPVGLQGGGCGVCGMGGTHRGAPNLDAADLLQNVALLSVTAGTAQPLQHR